MARKAKKPKPARRPRMISRWWVIWCAASASHRRAAGLWEAPQLERLEPMAMTKAERARVAKLEADLAMARAMAWPSYPEPIPMSEADIKVLMAGEEGCARGWYCNSYSGRVTYGCSTSFGHNSDGSEPNSRNMGVQYKSELAAYQVMRHELTRRYAEHLAKIDAKIAELELENMPF